MLLGSLFCLLQKLLEGGDDFPLEKLERRRRRNERDLGEICYTNAGGEWTVLGKYPTAKGLTRGEDPL